MNAHTIANKTTEEVTRLYFAELSRKDTAEQNIYWAKQFLPMKILEEYETGIDGLPRCHKEMLFIANCWELFAAHEAGKCCCDLTSGGYGLCRVGAWIDDLDDLDDLEEGAEEGQKTLDYFKSWKNGVKTAYADYLTE